MLKGLLHRDRTLLNRQIVNSIMRYIAQFSCLFNLICITLIMSNGTSSSALTQTYDLVVIGGGSAGLTAAKFAATFGKSVVIVEQSRLGGDCTWTGCVPSKSLIKSASIAHDIKNADKYGIDVKGEVKVDFEAVKNRLKQIQNQIFEEDDSSEALKNLGVETVEGKAFFEKEKLLKVTNSAGEVQQVAAKYGVLIATGASPKIPETDIEGLNSIKYLTYEDIFQLDSLPNELTVVGGGPIGCELSQAFSRLGSKVTQISKSLLPNDEPEAGEALEKVFAKEGIKRVKGKVKSVGPSGNNEKHVATCILANGVTETVTGDVMLVAVGRVPVVDGMGLDQLGVLLDEKGGGILVDKTLKTTVKSIYAAGDCTGAKQFTHYAGYQGAVAARNILLPLSDPGIYENVPATTFTSPEVASIGLTEAEASSIEKYNGKITVRFVPIGSVDRAECSSESDGFIKIIVHTKTLEILGATIMSTAGGELISEIAVAMKTKLKYDQLATVMHAYPTYSFALQADAAEVYYDKLVKLKPVLNALKRVGL